MASLRHAAAHGMSFMGGLRHEKHTFVHGARQINANVHECQTGNVAVGHTARL